MNGKVTDRKNINVLYAGILRTKKTYFFSKKSMINKKWCVTKVAHYSYEKLSIFE